MGLGSNVEPPEPGEEYQWSTLERQMKIASLYCRFMELLRQASEEPRFIDKTSVTLTLPDELKE